MPVQNHHPSPDQAALGHRGSEPVGSGGVAAIVRLAACSVLLGVLIQIASLRLYCGYRSPFQTLVRSLPITITGSPL